MTEEEIIDILENVFIFKNTSDKFTDLDLNAINGLLDLYNKQKEEIKELKKYDYRNIKTDDNNKIYSPNFTEGELHFMNFGIALYLSMQNFDKLNDKNDI